MLIKADDDIKGRSCIRGKKGSFEFCYSGYLKYLDIDFNGHNNFQILRYNVNYNIDKGSIFLCSTSEGSTDQFIAITNESTPTIN